MPLLEMNELGEVVTIGFDDGGEMGDIFSSIKGALSSAGKKVGAAVPKVITKVVVKAVPKALTTIIKAPAAIIKKTTGIDIMSMAAKKQGETAAEGGAAEQQAQEEIQYVDEYGNPITAEQAAAAGAAVPAATVTSNGTPLKVGVFAVGAAPAVSAGVKHPMAEQGLA